MGRVHLAVGMGGGDTRGDGTGGGGVFATGGGKGLATSCVSCCSYAVKVASAVLMLFSETLSQTSFGHISINSPSILTVLMATESP